MPHGVPKRCSEMLEKGSHDRSLPPRVVKGRVTELGLLARQMLQSGNKGEIIAAFQRSFYATIGGCLICVGSRTLGSGPLHVLCDRWPENVFSAGQSVTVVGAALDIHGMLLADFQSAAIWKPDPAPEWSLASLAIGLQAAGEIWCAISGDEGLAPLWRPLSGRPSHLIEAAMPGVDALTRIVECGLQESVPASADCATMVGLIGLGPGLTPSGDDFLLGALLTLGALGLAEARNSLWQICWPHLGRTNEISRAHLEAAALGYGAAALHEAVQATIAGRTDRLGHALSAVSEIGQTSGRDGFTGALVVLRTVRRHIADGAR